MLSKLPDLGSTQSVHCGPCRLCTQAETDLGKAKKVLGVVRWELQPAKDRAFEYSLLAPGVLSALSSVLGTALTVLLCSEENQQLGAHCSCVSDIPVTS